MLETKKELLINIIGLFVLWGILGTILFITYSSHGFTIRTPFVYVGGDEVSYMSEVKMMLDGNSWLKSDYLGAPFGTDRSSVISYYLFNDVHLLSFLFVKLIKNEVVATNLVYIVQFFLISGISYAVMLSRKTTAWIAILGSLVFSLQSYIFIRSTPHLMLSAYYTIPLIILLCLWIYEDDKFLKIEKNALHYKRNIIGVLFALLIASNGIGYYPVFACFFIFLAGMLKSFQNKKILGVVQSIFQCCEIALFIVLSVSGALIAKLVGHTFDNDIGRSLIDAERFGLKITHLFFPLKETGLSYLDNVINQYVQIDQQRFEVSEYLGYIGIMGFLLLLLVLFTKIKYDSQYKDLVLLSRLNVFTVLFATTGGFGTLFFLFVTKAVRCTNRMSIFIAFMSIYAVCLSIDYLMKQMKKQILKKSRRNMVQAGIVFSCIIVTVLSLKSQIIVNANYYEINRQYEEDSKYFEMIENDLSEGSMIYQLPYHAYPDGGVRKNMMPNQLFIPYLHTDNIKWSYGTIVGEKSQKWNELVSKMNTNELLDNLCYMGFSGIYIDADAYEDAELKSLQSSIKMILGVDPFVNQKGNKLFYNMENYYNHLKSTYSEKEWEHQAKIVKEYEK